jgi:hypothetical protein
MEGFAVFNTLGITLGGPIEVTLPGRGPVEIVGPSGRVRPFQWIDPKTRRALTQAHYGPKLFRGAMSWLAGLCRRRRAPE